MSKNPIFDKIKYFIIDMDGTFYLDGNIIDGAMDFLEKAKSVGKDFCFFTNNSSNNVEVCRTKLHNMGCDVTDSLGNFLFVRLPGFAGGDAYRALRERGILVRWFDVESIRDWLRITVGSDEEMQILLGTVRDLLNR